MKTIGAWKPPLCKACPGSSLYECVEQISLADNLGDIYDRIHDPNLFLVNLTKTHCLFTRDCPYWILGRVCSLKNLSQMRRR